jgi:putative endonuclease
MRRRSHNFDIGVTGEDIACDLLRKRGYKIIRRNFRTPFGEIDIIASCGNILVFVEVKTRINLKYGPPLASVTDTKIRNIKRNCEYYLTGEKNVNKDCRIDLISIILDGNLRLKLLKHIKNAFCFF